MLPSGNIFATPALYPASGGRIDVSYGDDSAAYVEFREVPELQPALSEKEGRPIYMDVTYIRVQYPGNTKNIYDQPLTEQFRQRFAKQYEAYQRTGQSVQAVGMPLTEWAAITRSQAMELKAIGIHTVEALAATADTSLNWLGARQLRDKAKLWLDQSKGGAELSQVVERIQHLEMDNEMLRGQVIALSAALQAVTPEGAENPLAGIDQAEVVKRGPGRPRKDEAYHATN